MTQILQQAIQRHQTGDYRGASDLYVEILKQAPEEPHVHYLLGNALMSLDELTASAQSLDRAVSLEPEKVEYHCALASLKLKSGELTESEAMCRRALKVDIAYDETHFLLGSILAKQGKEIESSQYFLRACIADPRSMRNWLVYIESLIQLQNFEAAEAACFEASVLNDSEPEMLFLKGRIMALTKRDDQAIEIWKGILSSKPEHLESRYQLGALFVSRKQFPEAEAVYLEALRYATNRLPPLASLGEISLRLNRPNAWLYFKECVELCPDNVELGKAYQKSLGMLADGGRP